MKLLKRQGGDKDRLRFYMHYDGYDVTTGSRGFAAEFSNQAEADQVAKHLLLLGGGHFEVVDSSDYPRKKPKGAVNI